MSSNSAASVINFSAGASTLNENETHEAESILDSVQAQEPKQDEVVAQAPSSSPKQKTSSNKTKIMILIGVLGVFIVIGFVGLNIFVGQETQRKPVQSLQSQPAVKPVEAAKPQVLTGDNIEIPALFPDEEPVQPKNGLTPEMHAALYGEGEKVQEPSQPDLDQPSMQLEEKAPVQVEIPTTLLSDLSALKEGFAAMQAQITEQTEQAIATKRSIAQTGQMLHDVQTTLNQIKREVIQVRTLAYENQDRIISIEKSAKSELGSKASSQVAQRGQIIDSTDSKASVAQMQAAKPAVPTSNAPLNNNRAENSVSSAPVVPAESLESYRPITQLFVRAVNGNKAVVAESSEPTKQYLLAVDESYKNLGRVTRIDLENGRVFGRHDSGVLWVINSK